MNASLMAVVASALVFFALVFLFIGWRTGRLTDTQKRTREQLRRVSMVGREEIADREILKDTRLSAIGPLDRLLAGSPQAKKLELLLYQAGLDMRVGTFLLIIALSGVGAAVLFQVFIPRPLFALFVGLVAASVPYFIVRNKKNKRMRQMEEQLPDAMDLMTSALRAGLSLPAALQLVAQEAPSPLAEEFGYTFDEQNLGIDIKDAMINLARRVDSTDLKFFVTAVVVQRETGGNLAEIMENIAEIIRERFRILGDVRALTAHGRFSGVVLSVLPIAMGFLISILNPDYMLGFLRDPVGQTLLLIALVMQIVGFFWIRRVVDIKV